MLKLWALKPQLPRAGVVLFGERGTMWDLCSRTTGGRCFQASHLTLHFIAWKLWVASALSPEEVGRTGMAEVLCICSSSQNNYARMRQGWGELKISQKLWKSWLANIHIKKKEKNKTKTKHLRPLTMKESYCDTQPLSLPQSIRPLPVINSKCCKLVWLAQHKHDYANWREA